MKKEEVKEPQDSKEEVVDKKAKESPSEERNEEQEERNEPEMSEEDRLKEELGQAKDKYLRLYSEFENFRRRTSKEKLEMVLTANQDLMSSLLPVLDDFERAKKSANDEESVQQGLDLIYNKFKKALEAKGLKHMKVEKGHDFDPDHHEAITQIPAPEEKLKGKVVDVVENGYYLGDKVIRFAKVVTGA